MSLIILPSVLALVVKIYVLGVNKDSDWIDGKWIGLVAVYAALNVSEVFIYLSLFFEISPTYLLKAHFMCTLLCIAASYNYVKNANLAFQAFANYLIYSTVIVFCLVIAFSDIMIGQYLKDTFPVKTSKGSLFYCYLVFCLSIVPLTLITLVFNYRSTSNPKERVDYAYTFIAFIPLAATVVIILTLMAFGFNANGSMIIPIATTLFLMVTVKGKITSNLSRDPRNWVQPLGVRAKKSRKISKAKTQFLLGNISYSEAISSIETALIDSLIDEHGGNISKASRESGIDRGMIYRKRTKS